MRTKALMAIGILALATMSSGCNQSKKANPPSESTNGTNVAAQAKSTGGETRTVDANATLADLQSTIRELSATNDKGGFGLSAAESTRVKAALAGMSRDMSGLQNKYRATNGPVDRVALNAEVEAVLDKNHAADKALILSLRSREITAKGHECENFCWRSCGHNSVGEWVCFLSCRRRC